MPRLPNLSSHLGHPFLLALHVFNIVAIGHCVTTYGIAHASPMGPSMLPTYSVYGEGLLISKYHRYGRGVRVGDAVAYTIPTDPESQAIKRVLGMPGDYVLVDAPGQRVSENGATMLQVPEGHCWLVGDNLPVSRDSRMYGPVPLGLIRGKVLAQWSPWGERRWIRNPLDWKGARCGGNDEEDVD